MKSMHKTSAGEKRNDLQMSARKLARDCPRHEEGRPRTLGPPGDAKAA